MTEKTVQIIGDGTDKDPYRPDYDNPYDRAKYNWDEGTVAIVPSEQS